MEASLSHAKEIVIRLSNATMDTWRPGVSHFLEGKSSDGRFDAAGIVSLATLGSLV